MATRKLCIRLSDGKQSTLYLEPEAHTSLTTLKDHYQEDASTIVQRLLSEGVEVIEEPIREAGDPIPEGNNGSLNLLAVHFGGNGSAVLNYLLKEAVRELNISIASGKDDPDKLIRNLPPSHATIKENVSNRWKKRNMLMESGGFNPPRYWPVEDFQPYTDWEQGKSYYLKTETGFVYVWSENLEDDEREQMIRKILGPYSGLALGLSQAESYASAEEYKHQVGTMLPVAESIADLWLASLRILHEATARNETIEIPKDAECDRSTYLRNKEWGPQLCAAWLQWVKQHPETPSDRWTEACKELGITHEQHNAIRNGLTFNYTARRGLLAADYPWYGF